MYGHPSQWHWSPTFSCHQNLVAARSNYGWGSSQRALWNWSLPSIDINWPCRCCHSFRKFFMSSSNLLPLRLLVMYLTSVAQGSAPSHSQIYFPCSGSGGLLLFHQGRAVTLLPCTKELPNSSRIRAFLLRQLLRIPLHQWTWHTCRLTLRPDHIFTKGPWRSNYAPTIEAGSENRTVPMEWT